MNIVMMTNTYFPIVGGLEKSVQTSVEEYRKRGHRVLVVCPEDYDAPNDEKGVYRVPAIQNFNNTDFSVELPVPNDLRKVLKDFQPDIVHTHHPFLIGDTALRIASEHNIPIVFTHHTLYEENIHYVPGNSKIMKKFVIELSKGFANLCDHVIVPSKSVETMLKQRGVTRPIDVVPTGIYLDHFRKGDGRVFRKFFEIPQDAFVTGIISRIAAEKNVGFLTEAMTAYLKKNKKAYFVVVGQGPSLEKLQDEFRAQKLDDRLVCTGLLKGTQLISAYKALDVFCFASHSETQGLVLAEAMATGAPVVGVDAPGVREVIKHKKNGYMVQKDDVQEFCRGIKWVANQSPAKKGSLTRMAHKTAREYGIDKCVDKALKLYQNTLKDELVKVNVKDSHWQRSKRILKIQTDLFSNFTRATGDALWEIPDEVFRKAKIGVRKATKRIFS